MTQLTNLLDDRAMRSVQVVQVENPWMLDYVRQLTAANDVDVRYAPPGVDAQLFRPLDIQDPERDPYILCVGRLSDPRKNIVLLLKAYARLAPLLRDKARLVVAGSSGPKDEFWKIADALGLRDRIELIVGPTRQQLVALYQAATVFALASDEEGLGVVLLEAMACGVPVVSTRSGGPDGIIEDGVDGYLIALNNEEALAARLSQLLGDFEHRRLIGRAGRRTVERRYANDVAGRAFLEIWDGLLARSRPRRVP
jgi:glycosyltransferase involved in cell wall biosynthesis